MEDIPNGAVIDEFSKQILPLHMTTMCRLFSIDADASLLYVFLVKNAIHQDTNSVWCTNTFVRKGLKWGSMRVVRARGILEDNGFVEKIVPRSSGQFAKHYTKIHYINNPRYSGAQKVQPQDVALTRNPEMVKPETVKPETVRPVTVFSTSGETATNALDKKVNALDKKENAFNNVLDHPTYSLILKEWNKIKVTIHKDFNGSTKKLINKVIELIGEENLLEAIENYGRVYHNKLHYFSTKWTLNDFLSRGCSVQGLKYQDDDIPKGFWHFLGRTNIMDTLKDLGEQTPDPWDGIRKDFLPLTSVYKEIFSEKTQRYYGFTKEHINSEIRWEDTETMIAGKYEIEFNHFMELEWMIAGMLFRRKMEPENLKICQLYMRAWNKTKGEFKSKARAWLKNDYEFFG